jgi:hypothetical protein
VATLFTPKGIPVYRSETETIFDWQNKPVFYIIDNATVHSFENGKMMFWIDGLWLYPAPQHNHPALYFDLWERETETATMAKEAARTEASDLEFSILQAQLTEQEWRELSKDDQIKLAKKRIADEKFRVTTKAALGDDAAVEQLIEQALQEEADAATRKAKPSQSNSPGRPSGTGRIAKQLWSAARSVLSSRSTRTTNVG